MTHLAVEENNVALAGVLGVLPGGGSSYTERVRLRCFTSSFVTCIGVVGPIQRYQRRPATKYAATKIRVNRLKADELSEIEEKLRLKQIKMEESCVEKSQVEKKYKAGL